MKVSRVEEMRSLDRRATEEFGITQEILMENAGQAAFYVILKELGVAGKRFVVFCGAGNNGGDGFVVARKLHSMGAAVKIFLLGDMGKVGGAAKANYEIISRMQIEVRAVESIDQVRADTVHCDAIVDAIFGTGLVREVSGKYRDAIDLINASNKTVFSLDIPSGVNGDTGEVMGSAVNSDYTVSFGLPKIGNMLYPGYGLCGKLYVTHISFPPSLQAAEEIKVHVSLPARLPERLADTHKGSYGKALFIAGSSSYLGAPYFSALSFLKAGGGLSYLATPRSISPFLASKGSEVVFLPQEETDSGSLALLNEQRLLEVAGGVDIVVLGPGLSLVPETQELVKGLAKSVEVPLLIDGDGLTAIAGDLKLIKARRAPTILTPHVGEMSRITGLAVDEVSRDRIGVVQRAAQDTGSIIVLKGAHSLTGCPDGNVHINTSGNPGMATAGSGDALTGAIAAMYGLGLPIETAARMGVFVHGVSGDLAADEKGADGITAQDITDYLPDAVRYCREEFEEISATSYGSLHVI
jgi:hydroxyethylthiazole kinase-like uncharacterized protein yjeF